MTRAEQVLRILYHCHGMGNYYERPFAVTQDGMAEIMNTSRGHVSIVVKKLEESGLITHYLIRAHGGSVRRRCYDLTPKGIPVAEAIVRQYTTTDYMSDRLEGLA